MRDDDSNEGVGYRTESQIWKDTVDLHRWIQGG